MQPKLAINYDYLINLRLNPFLPISIIYIYVYLIIEDYIIIIINILHQTLQFSYCYYDGWWMEEYIHRPPPSKWTFKSLYRIDLL